ncbi:Thymidylate kinase [Elasticomyces elasticus]|nr:Thymidylate kinase [Elasticomyces elasticus]
MGRRANTAIDKHEAARLRQRKHRAKLPPQGRQAAATTEQTAQSAILPGEPSIAPREPPSPARRTTTAAPDWRGHTLGETMVKINTAMRGKLIVFEGLDRAGKSTQCERLVKRLQNEGHTVKHMRFPDRTTPIGQMIDNYLRGQSQQEDHVIHLLFSANRWEAAESIRTAIKSGTTVIIDRYYYSGIVYSAAKNNPTLSLDWARHPEIGLPRPDACIFLDLAAAEAARRGGYGEERYEKREMQDRVRELFARLQKLGSPDKDGFFQVEAGAPVDEVEAAILGIVKRVFERVDADGAPLRDVEP